MPGSASSAVDKALDLLEAIADSDRPQRLSELAARVGLHRATAHRVLVDLVARGWVLRAGDHYLPGPAQLRLSDAAARNSLATLCRPVMESLSAETGLMVNLQVLEASGTRVVEVVQPERLLMIAHLRDQVLTLDRFAGPVAMVANLDEVAREPYVRAAGGTDALRRGAPAYGRRRLRPRARTPPTAHRLAEPCRPVAPRHARLRPDPRRTRVRLRRRSAPRSPGRAGSRDRTARRGHHPARWRRRMSTTGSSVLVLDGADTAAALDLPELLAAVRVALVAISRGTVSAPPRIAARAPAGLLGCMPAHVPGLGLAAKLVSVFDAPGAGDGHSTHFGLVAVFDEHDGRPAGHHGGRSADRAPHGRDRDGRPAGARSRRSGASRSWAQASRRVPSWSCSPRWPRRPTSSSAPATPRRRARSLRRSRAYGAHPSATPSATPTPSSAAPAPPLR